MAPGAAGREKGRVVLLGHDLCWERMLSSEGAMSVSEGRVKQGRGWGREDAPGPVHSQDSGLEQGQPESSGSSAQPGSSEGVWGDFPSSGFP